MADSASYKNIFKTTFLFGFVQVFNILVKVGLHKVVALILGPSGMGTIGLFNNTILMIRNITGLGIGQSAVRDISEAHETNRVEKYSQTIIVVKRVVLLTCLLGVATTIIFSPLISRYTFGNYNYTVSYIYLSIAVGASVIANGQSAILTGMHRLRQLAYSSMIGAVVGLLSGVPFYFFFGHNGIVPSLIVSNLTPLIVTGYYIRRIPIQPIKLSVCEFGRQASIMVKTGSSLMIQGLMIQVCNFVIAAYISIHDNLSILGYYQAGVTIIGGYFGVILTSMTTEYYPRISAIHNDNEKLNDAVNAQSEMGLMIAFPLILLFIVFSDFFFSILYSREFLAGVEYVNYAVMGTATIICSNCMGMVLLAKQKYKVILVSSFFANICVLTINIVLYHIDGLRGLGLGYFFSGLLQLIMYNRIMDKMFCIKFYRSVLWKWFMILILIMVINYARIIQYRILKYAIETILVIFSTSFSFCYLKNKMGIKLTISLKKRLS